VPDTPGIGGPKIKGPLVTPTISPVEALAPPAAPKKIVDAFGKVITPKTGDAPAAPSALKAGDTRLGKSTALVEVLLSAVKASFADRKIKAGGSKDSLAERDLAKRVGLILQTTPYGAPISVIMSALTKDPQISARYPDLSFADVVALHTRFPSIVPPPHNPVDMGAAFSPTTEGMIDLYTSFFVRARPELLGKMVPSTQKYVDTRYSTDGHLGLGESLFPALHVITGSVHKTTADLTRTELFLRRVIVNAPPHWTATDIAKEHNKYVEFYGALLFNGSKDTAEKAMERALLTPEQVVDVMARAPQTSGAKEMQARQTELREAVMTALRSATPNSNLYELLDGVAATFADKSRPTPHHYGHDVYKGAIFTQPPGPAATLTAEDLLRFVTADPGLSNELDRLVGERSKGFDKILADNIVRKFGKSLSRTSVSEIVRTMQKEDPVYNEPLVQHLLSSFPKIFGSARIETGRAEVNYLLAQQVADGMDKMFPGASLEDVAKFLRQKGPEFNAIYPDFSAQDVKLLQQAFRFLPQWDTKPDHATLGGNDRVSLESVIKFATMTLGRNEAKALQKSIFGELAKPGGTEKIPPELVGEIDKFFSRGLLGIVAGAAGASGEAMSISNDKGTLAERQTGFQQRSLFEKLLGAEPGGALGHTEIVAILTSKHLLGMPEAKASGVATALIQAREGDLESLHETAQKLFSDHPQGEMILMKLTNQFLGREALISKIESNIFANKELRASFARFSRIPLRLPMIQHVVDKYKDQQPLADTNVLMVQHMLGQAYPQISGYKQLGMDAKNCVFVGIPYHKNEEVEQAVAKSFGVDVRVPARDMEELYKAIEKGVDDMIDLHKKNGKPVLIVCDGPHARDYFRKKYPQFTDVVRFTEQTALGDRPEQQQDKSMRVVSYARTDLKQKHEAKFIGQAVARAVNAVLTQLGTGYEEKPVLILGYGAIGQATAEAFGGDRAKMYIFDPYLTPEQEADAKSKGYTVLKDKSQISAGKFMTIGCSGHLSIDEEQIMASEPNAIYVSASSKLVEIDMRKLREMATDEQGNVRKILAAEVNDQQTWHYWLKDGTIRTVIADGLPANFNDINSVPPEFIDMTMGLSLAAAVQALSKKDLGFSQLNSGDAAELNTLYESMIERMHAEAKALAAGEAPK